MSIHRRTVDKSKLNRDAALPYDLRLLTTLHAGGVAKLRRNWVYLDPG